VDESDGVLWLRAKADDSRAFETLFERYAQDVYNFCFRRTASWSQAEDLVSEVFLEAWRKRRGLELTSSALTLRPWLLGVAHNKIRNQSRGMDIVRRALGRLTERYEPDFAEGALDRVEDQQRMRRLNQAVAQLPKEEADAFLLYAWGDLQYREVAALLGVPIGTVRSRLARARRRLQELDSRFRHEQDEDDMKRAKETTPRSEGSGAS
jgi:RNA polymerase sigma factor (sigma-70 family)